MKIQSIDYYIVNYCEFLNIFANSPNVFSDEALEQIFMNINPYNFMYCKEIPEKWCKYIVQNNIYILYQSGLPLNILCNTTNDFLLEELYKIVPKDSIYINKIFRACNSRYLKSKLSQEDFNNLCKYITKETLQYLYYKEWLWLSNLCNSDNIKDTRTLVTYILRKTLKYDYTDIALSLFYKFPDIAIFNIKSNIEYFIKLYNALYKDNYPNLDELIDKAINDKRFIRSYKFYYNNDFAYLNERNKNKLRKIEFLQSIQN